jgi:radical SAM superfamily enzyme YgiQ (UPF0313 family)
MRICLLEHPRIPSLHRFNDIANTPLWSCLMGGYAAAALTADGYEVTVVDAGAEHLDFDQTRWRVADLAPDLLAVNAVYFWEHTGRLLEFITVLKGQWPGMHINLFGFFPSLAPGQILSRCPAVDSVCVGECENTLRELAAAIRRGRTWQTVPGLAFSGGRQTVFSAHRPPDPDPDHFALPLRRAAGVISKEDSAALLASRGCPNHCSFCPIPAFYNRGALWRGRSPGNILAEINLLIAMGYRRIYFVDPNFVGPGRSGRRRILSLMEALQPLNIRFGMETRPGDLDEGLMAAMTGAGLESLLLGIESASPGVLGSLSKHASIGESRRALGLCREAGIEPEVGFIMHTPDTTLEDLAGNLAFLADNRLLDRLDRTANLLCHRQVVFRGTPGYEKYANQGRIFGTDPLGFEARIARGDHRAEWVADVMVPVCLDVLRLMGDPGSSLYWNDASANSRVAGKVNDCLVTLFRNTLRSAQRGAHLPAAQVACGKAREKVFQHL